MAYRITIICDNGVGPLAGTLGEHGFAALLEGDGTSYLFDTGQGQALVHNAQRMNRDLRRIEGIILSHGHYDHTGGLWPLLQLTGERKIFAHPGIFSERYRVRDTGEHLSIGIPYTREFVAGLGGRFSWNTDFLQLADGLFLTGEVPRGHHRQPGDSGLFCDSAGCVPDPFRDDQSLVITAGEGLVIILGCCHAGILNTIEHAREKTGIKEVHAVVGGTHLGFAPQSHLEEVVRALHQLKVRRIVGSHCTGFHAAARLEREFPGRFHPGHVGYTLEV